MAASSTRRTARALLPRDKSSSKFPGITEFRNQTRAISCQKRVARVFGANQKIFFVVFPLANSANIFRQLSAFPCSLHAPKLSADSHCAFSCWIFYGISHAHLLRYRPSLSVSSLHHIFFPPSLFPLSLSIFFTIPPSNLSTLFA